jgi:alpha-tubulin suppressor-like RCC1 family protein
MSKQLVKLQSVYGRGVNFFGQLALGNMYQSAEDFVEIPGLHRVEAKSIHSSYAQSMCLLGSGELLLWGWPLDVRSQMQIIQILNTNPKLAKFVQRYSPFPWISLREGVDFPRKEASITFPLEEVSFGGAFIVARDSEGRGYTWGDNHRGQCGTKDYSPKLIPAMAQDLLDKFIVKCVAGYQHSLFLTHTGEVFASGRVGNFAFGRVPIKLITYKACITQFARVNIEGIVDMAAGQNHSLFLNEYGKVYAVGKNEYGQCGQVSTKTYVEEPAEVFLPEKAVSVACGTKHSLVLGESGMVYGFGNKFYGQLDGMRAAADEDQSSALPIVIPSSAKVLRIFAGFERSAALMENLELWTWGGQDYRYLNGDFYERMSLVNGLLPKQVEEDVVDVALGFMHTLVMTTTH